MEEATEFQDWEVLHGPDSVTAVAVAISAPTSATAAASRGAGDDSDGVIKPDYFDLNTENRCPRRSSSFEGDRERGSLPDSDDSSWIKPNSGSRLLVEPSREGLGFVGAEIPRTDPRGLWAPDVPSGGGQETPLHDHVGGELDSSVSSLSEVVLEGVNSNGGEGEGEGAYLGGTWETDVVEAGSEVSGGLDSAGDSPNITVLETVSPVETSNGDSDLENVNVAKGEKAGMVWWKLPMELLKFCVFRMRPVWSISIAAALVGVLILGRRLYKKKPKSRSIPLKVSVDDKRVSHFMVRATHLNEAFSAVKRIPVIRSTLPTAGVTSWPVVALR